MGVPNLSGCVADAVDCRTPTPDDEAAKREYWSIVQAALNPTQFRVVSMYFRESLTQEDIAERLGRSQQAVFGMLRRSIGRLAQPRVRSKLERAIPAGRRPPVTGHRAVHAYQVAYAPGESPEDKAVDRQQAADIADDERRRVEFHEAWDEYTKTH